MTHLRSILRFLMFTVSALLVSMVAFATPSALPRLERESSRIETIDVPEEARITLAYVRAHAEAPPGYVGGRHFGNFGRSGEQKLPQLDASSKRIEYREWDIHPKLPGRNRGAERLVTGSDGRAWFTADHYTRFTEIK